MSGGILTGSPVAGYPVILFEKTLSAATTAIDTGAILSQIFKILEVFIIVRTDEATLASSINVNVNNDGGSNYDRCTIRNTNTTVSGTTTLASASWALRCPGSSATANVFGAVHIVLPGYSNTVTHKPMISNGDVMHQTAASTSIDKTSGSWRSTAAINRIAINGNGGSNLEIGTSMLVYGR